MLPTASPAAAQAGPTDTVPPYPPSEGKPGYWRCTAQTLPAQGDWGALEWSSPKKEGPNVCLLPYSRLLAPSLQSSPCSPPDAIHPTPFGGACWGCSAKTYQIINPQGLTQRKTSRLDPHWEWIWGWVIQPGAPCGHAQKETCRGLAKFIIKTQKHKTFPVEFSYFQA